jgi:transposase
MNKSTKSSPEARERSVRMVQEHRGEYPSLWAPVESMAPKIGCVPQTLLGWVQRPEIDTGVRGGVTTAEAQRVKELVREVKTGLVAPLPKRAAAPIGCIEVAHITATERLHRSRDGTGHLRRHQQVHMVGHQHISVYPTTVCQRRLTELTQVTPIVLLAQKQGWRLLPC